VYDAFVVAVLVWFAVVIGRPHVNGYIRRKT